MRPDPEMIPVLIDTANALKGSRKRLFVARTAEAMGRGGQRRAGDHLGRGRATIRKGMRGLHGGMTCPDAFPARGRHPVEGRSPRSPDDIKGIADGRSQADARFQTDRLFTRIGAAEVRRRSATRKGYTDAELPTQQAIDTKLNRPGYRPTRAAKRRPPRGPSRPTPSQIG